MDHAVLGSILGTGAYENPHISLATGDSTWQSHGLSGVPFSDFVTHLHGTASSGTYGNYPALQSSMCLGFPLKSWGQSPRKGKDCAGPDRRQEIQHLAMKPQKSTTFSKQLLLPLSFWVLVTA